MFGSIGTVFSRIRFDQHFFLAARFDHDMWWIETAIIGKYHTSEIPFAFYNEWPPVLHLFNKKDHEMADVIGKWWTVRFFFFLLCLLNLKEFRTHRGSE